MTYDATTASNAYSPAVGNPSQTTPPKPSVAAGAAAGTSPASISVTGNDQFGSISITTGTTATTGTLLTATFSKPYSNSFSGILEIFPLNAATATAIAKFSPGTLSRTAFTIAIAAALTDSTAYKFGYRVTALVN